MPDLLLELFSEEIPARMQARAAEDLRKAVTDRLVDAGLVYEGAKAFVTPRRLALAVHGVPARQPDVREEKKGPRVGAPDNAIAGFLKAAGLKSISEAKVQPDKKGDFYVAVIEKPGRAAIDVIGEILRRRHQDVPVAEIHALGRAVEGAGRAQLGAAAALDRRDLRAGNRGAGNRAVLGRRHRGGQRNARPSLSGAGAVHGAPARRLPAKARQGQGGARCGAPPRHHPDRGEAACLRARARTHRGRRPAWPKSPGWSNGRWC